MVVFPIMFSNIKLQLFYALGMLHLIDNLNKVFGGGNPCGKPLTNGVKLVNFCSGIVIGGRLQNVEEKT
ncbi:hypothetical protein MTR_3g016255 [Medicago truncatula]|uniref:Uncharacterized protein n=1 Tax=Medicago truncatula TaxID=3880 RepID=A0A072UT87_MEDTR|nr:hypothetical protein MTR_3g016255 [Medicago truncatula]